MKIITEELPPLEPQPGDYFMRPSVFWRTLLLIFMAGICVGTSAIPLWLRLVVSLFLFLGALGLHMTVRRPH